MNINLNKLNNFSQISRMMTIKWPWVSTTRKLKEFTIEVVKSFFKSQVIEKSILFRSAEVSSSESHSERSFFRSRHGILLTNNFIIIIIVVVFFGLSVGSLQNFLVACFDVYIRVCNKFNLLIIYIIKKIKTILSPYIFKNVNN